MHRYRYTERTCKEIDYKLSSLLLSFPDNVYVLTKAHAD